MTAPGRFRLALERVGIVPRPLLIPAELVEAQEQRRAEEEEREAALIRETTRAMVAELPWEEIEGYTASHNEHGDVKTSEREVYDEDNRTLLARVCVALTCSECLEPLERWIVPPVPVPRRELEDRITQLRADLSEVASTGRRPARVQAEHTARWRKIQVVEYVTEHRQHGRVTAGEGSPPRSGLSLGPTVEQADRVWLFCAGCRGTSTWSTESPEEAAVLLAEITRAIAG
jgi:hypothetical protein